jgi:hypothetical protein
MFTPKSTGSHFNVNTLAVMVPVVEGSVQRDCFQFGHLVHYLGSVCLLYLWV